MTHLVQNRRLATLAALALVIGLPACSDDDGADVRGSGGTVQIIGPAPAGDGGSVSAVGAGCTTRGSTTRLAARSIEVGLDEWSVTAPPSVPRGVTRIVVKNFGAEPHGLVVTKATSPAELPMKDGAVDLDALAAGATFRLEAFAGNTICEGTFDLPVGTYLLFSPDATPGTKPSSIDRGMVTTFTVVEI